MRIYSKWQDIRFNTFLTNQEFRCKCKNESCTATILDGALSIAFLEFRALCGVPVIINSGYRCPQHNAAISGATRSRHMMGQAVDISRKTLGHLSDRDIKERARIAGFKFVKFYSAWIHLDVRG